MPALTLPSFAKINLTLEVLGRRPDGYHELRTIFQSLALHDTIVFTTTRRPVTLACSDPDVPVDERNLVWKAAHALWQETGQSGVPRGIAVELHKCIPAEAGLGGGSSNAAVALLALDRLWRLRLSARRLLEIAGTLGADVPFFLVGGTALGLGRGELVYPMTDVRPAWVVLVKPPFGVSTAAAYGWLKNGDCPLFSEGSQTAVGNGHTVAKKKGDSPLFRVWNALEGAVEAHHPELKRIREALLRAGAGAAALSGSGSTVFGLFDRAREARNAADQLAWPRHLVAVTRTLARGPYSRRLAGLRLPGREPIV
jgi:4-diphosphocytidyl-2-C-methyl-D-erythritol kinase